MYRRSTTVKIKSLFLFLIIMTFCSPLVFSQIGEDTRIDRLPIQYIQGWHDNPEPAAVVTVDGFDNYFLGN